MVPGKESALPVKDSAAATHGMKGASTSPEENDLFRDGELKAYFEALIGIEVIRF